MSETLFEVPGPAPTAETKWTERMVLDLLLARYSAQTGGNGPRYAFAEHVRSRTGPDAPRCADFIAMSLWASDGEALHGHEVKVSRSDWLAELRDPSKAEAFRPYVDYWWLVVSDRSIVRDDLPLGWGLMAPTKAGGLRVVKPAARLKAEPMPKTMTACLLRAVAKTAQRSLVRNERARARMTTSLCRRVPGVDYAEHRETVDELLDVARQAGGL